MRIKHIIVRNSNFNSQTRKGADRSQRQESTADGFEKGLRQESTAKTRKKTTSRFANFEQRQYEVLEGKDNLKMG